jgi:hypothetical protein
MIMAPIRAVLVAVVATQMAAPGFNVDWAVVLPVDSVATFRATFCRWCSRPGPALAGYWTPDPEAIRGPEAALSPALQRALEQKFKDSPRRPTTEEYYRQYIGIQLGRRRVIYVNGFHKLHLEQLARTRRELARTWETRVVHVCDGGTMYFGAEYDPATRQLRNLEFNGPGTLANLGGAEGRRCPARC